jgi:hypothetical protein
MRLLKVIIASALLSTVFALPMHPLQPYPSDSLPFKLHNAVAEPGDTIRKVDSEGEVKWMIFGSDQSPREPQPRIDETIAGNQLGIGTIFSFGRSGKWVQIFAGSNLPTTEAPRVEKSKRSLLKFPTFARNWTSRSVRRKGYERLLE